MDLEERAKLHSAGATVIHRNPYESIKVNRNDYELSDDFHNKWVVPFYIEILSLSEENGEVLVKNLSKIVDEVSPEIIKKLLGDFNWRTRITGAFYAAYLNATEFAEEIGKHLLKSEVCFAGREYCSTLAIFNVQSSYKYINQYLEYYLTRRDLNFDQDSAISALKYLDDVNGTNELEKHKVAVKEFYKTLPDFIIEQPIPTQGIEDRIRLIEQVKKLQQ